MPDHLTQSRLELRLQEEIARAANPLDADCKRAELAAYHSRLGRTDEARSTLTLLHQRYDGRPHVAISAWVNLVEGLLGYFETMDPASRDKILRSHALSTAAGLTYVRALSAAWLANMDYSTHDIEAMGRHLLIAFSIADETLHSVQSRASLVVAQALHLANNYQKALSWYARARGHANAEGDDAMLSAVLHNMAWLHMATMRQAICTGQALPAENSIAMTSAESTRNFDQFFKVATVPTLEPILRAQVLSLMGRHSEALDIYTQALPAANFRGADRIKGELLADVAWCRVCVGDESNALAETQLAEASLLTETQPDELGAAHFRLAQIFEKLGMHGEAARHRETSAVAWFRFGAVQERIVKALANVTLSDAEKTRP